MFLVFNFYSVNCLWALKFLVELMGALYLWEIQCELSRQFSMICIDLLQAFCTYCIPYNLLCRTETGFVVTDDSFKHRNSFSVSLHCKFLFCCNLWVLWGYVRRILAFLLPEFNAQTSMTPLEGCETFVILALCCWFLARTGNRYSLLVPTAFISSPMKYLLSEVFVVHMFGFSVIILSAFMCFPLFSVSTPIQGATRITHKIQLIWFIVFISTLTCPCSMLDLNRIFLVIVCLWNLYFVTLVILMEIGPLRLHG
jgi:hypothetical protein